VAVRVITCSTDTVKLLNSYENSTYIFSALQKNVDSIRFWNYDFEGVNTFDALTMLDFFSSIKNPNEQAIELWKFVTSSGFYHEFDYNQSLNDNVDPIALVTFPYFMCGEKAGILANLANLSGIPARTLSLKGHEVTEIFYDAQWHMFDADHGYYFLNNKGYIASAAQLAANNRLITEQFLATANNQISKDRCKKYKSYLSGFSKKCISYSSVIKNYNYPNVAVTLFPGDSVVFQLKENNIFTRWFYPGFNYKTAGFYLGTPDTSNINVIVKDNGSVIYNRRLPYYAKKIVVCTDSVMNSNVRLKYFNRLVGKYKVENLGILSDKSSCISRLFEAPSKGEIYYDFDFEFSNIGINQLKHIHVTYEFEFNSVTFPFSKKGKKIVFCEGCDENNVLNVGIVSNE
jgi:hypothetical protein